MLHLHVNIGASCPKWRQRASDDATAGSGCAPHLRGASIWRRSWIRCSTTRSQHSPQRLWRVVSKSIWGHAHFLRSLLPLSKKEEIPCKQKSGALVRAQRLGSLDRVTFVNNLIPTNVWYKKENDSTDCFDDGNKVVTQLSPRPVRMWRE